MKNGELKIEKGIKIPPKRGKGYIEAFSKMKIGESIWIPGDYSYQNAYAYFKKGGSTARREGDGFRIWRIK